MAPVGGVTRGEGIEPPQAGIGPRAFLEIDGQMPSDVVGVCDARLCDLGDLGESGADMDKLDGLEVVEAHAMRTLHQITRVRRENARPRIVRDDGPGRRAGRLRTS